MKKKGCLWFYTGLSFFPSFSLLSSTLFLWNWMINFSPVLRISSLLSFWWSWRESDVTLSLLLLLFEEEKPREEGRRKKNQKQDQAFKIEREREKEVKVQGVVSWLEGQFSLEAFKFFFLILSLDVILTSLFTSPEDSHLSSNLANVT